MRLVLFMILTYPVWVISIMVSVLCWHFIHWGGFPRSDCIGYAILDWCIGSWPWYLLVLFSILGFNRSGFHTWLIRTHENVRHATVWEWNRIRNIVEMIRKEYLKKTGKKLRPIHVCVVESQLPNAAMLGNDTLIVNSGILGWNDGIIGGVIAHEVGHLHYGDSIKLMDLMFLKRFTLFLTLIPIVLFVWAVVVGNMRPAGNVIGGRHSEIFTLFSVVFFGEFMTVLYLLVRRVVFGNFTGSGWIARLLGRTAEYRADDFAVDLGWGVELDSFLAHLSSWTSEDNSFKAEINRTHPGMAKRRDRIAKKLADARRERRRSA